jgi:hypothetical protein
VFTPFHKPTYPYPYGRSVDETTTSRKVLFFFSISIFNFLVKNTPSTSLSHCHAWPTCRTSQLVEPDQWLGRFRPAASFPPRSLVPLLSHDSPSDCVAAPPPRSIPMSSVGLRRRDAAQSIDQVTVVPPVREICSIASSSSASPSASEARDSGHGDLELALELLGLVHGGAWAW